MNCGNIQVSLSHKHKQVTLNSKLKQRKLEIQSLSFKCAGGFLKGLNELNKETAVTELLLQLPY